MKQLTAADLAVLAAIRACFEKFGLRGVPLALLVRHDQTLHPYRVGNPPVISAANVSWDDWETGCPFLPLLVQNAGLDEAQAASCCATFARAIGSDHEPAGGSVNAEIPCPSATGRSRSSGGSCRRWRANTTRWGARLRSCTASSAIRLEREPGGYG